MTGLEPRRPLCCKRALSVLMPLDKRPLSVLMLPRERALSVLMPPDKRALSVLMLPRESTERADAAARESTQRADAAVENAIADTNDVADEHVMTSISSLINTDNEAGSVSAMKIALQVQFELTPHEESFHLRMRDSARMDLAHYKSEWPSSFTFEGVFFND